MIGNMKNMVQRKRLLVMIMLMLGCLQAVAQMDEVDEDEDASGASLEPSAPIDDYILPMLLLGTVTGYYLIKRKRDGINQQV